MTNTPSPTDEDRELIGKLTRKVQRFPATGGAGISATATDGFGNPVETKSFSYITDDGYRLVNPDGPAAADRLESLLLDRAKLEEALRAARPFVNHLRSVHGDSAADFVWDKIDAALSRNRHQG